MAIKVERFGETPDGSQVDLYTLTNENGVSASFTNLGGIWVSMMVPDKDGKLADVVLGYDTVEKYLVNSPHLGATIGRNANRIGNAAFTLNGIRYELYANDGPNNLHSAPAFYRTRIWEVELDESSLGSRVSFSLNSPDMDQGYPGNAQITVSYTLTDENSVMIHYHMVSDQDTVANFTNHSYVNLAGHGKGNIGTHQVWIDADYFTPIDSVLIPDGRILPVKGTTMAFPTMKPIGRDIGGDDEQLVLGNGYDHNWVLNHKAGELSLCAKAYEPESGRLMEVYTDLPGVQFYTANFLTGDMPGKEGAVYGFRHAYCFETQYYPDSVNKPQFPSPFLKAGEVYETTTIYKFL